MNDFFHFIFSSPNLIATIVLSFCFVYWLIVIIGLIDLDMLDLDIDVDVDTDPAGASGEVGIAWLNKVLHFFNLGRIPFMLWLSIIMLIAWSLVVIINYSLSINSFLIGTLIFLAAFVVAMLIAKPLTFPLVKMFDKMEESEGLKSYVGKIGEVMYANRDNTPGEIEIVHDGSRLRIFVLPSSAEIVLHKNQKVLVIGPSDREKIYLVEPYN